MKLAYITLHVGLGTFRPVKAEEVTEHHMHSEFCMMPKEAAEIINETKKKRRARGLRRYDLLPDAGIPCGR